MKSNKQIKNGEKKEMNFMKKKPLKIMPQWY